MANLQVSPKHRGPKTKWLKVIEFAIVGLATWLDPSAGFLLFLLKLCFQILIALQPEADNSKQNKGK